eukprot:scaffold97652_cov18-Tisochrysis_lutea.AAC.1
MWPLYDVQLACNGRTCSQDARSQNVASVTQAIGTCSLPVPYLFFMIGNEVSDHGLAFIRDTLTGHLVGGAVYGWLDRAFVLSLSCCSARASLMESRLLNHPPPCSVLHVGTIDRSRSFA